MKITCLLFDPSETSYAVNTALNVIMLLGLLRSEKMTPLLPTVLWQGRFGKIRSENPGLAPHTHPRVSRRHKVAAAVKFCATLGQQKRDTNSPCPSVGRNNNFSVSLQFNSLSWWNGHANQSLAALHSSQLPSQQTWETEPQGQTCTRLWLHPYRSTCVCSDATRVHRTLLEGAAVLLKQVRGSSHRTTRPLSEGFILLGSN